MASPAWRMEPISRSTRSSMPFSPTASSSYSSRTPRTGMRACRSPAATAATARLKSAKARLTLRLSEQSARKAQQDDDDTRAPDGADDADHRGAARPDVRSHEHQLARGQPDLAAVALGLHHRPVRVGVGDAKGGLGRGAGGIIQRRLGQVAGDRVRGLVHQQVEVGPVAHRPLDHGLVQRRQSAAGVDGLKRVQLAPHFLVGAAGHLAGGGHIDVG